MRNARKIDENTVITVDNSGCIGEKELDVVQVANSLTAYFSTRVVLLEQWCAGAEPTHVFVSNFTGEHAWADYEKGIKRAFDEIGLAMPTISGSTESNFSSLQSGISLMLIGKVQFQPTKENLLWYVIGKPLVGHEVIQEAQSVAKLNEIYNLFKLKIANQIWPVGSKGILSELKRILPGRQFDCSLDLYTSGGPATSVIVGIPPQNLKQFQQQISTPYEEIQIL